MTKFIVGDLVRLRSGGPLMTIATLDGDNAECVWVEDGVEKQESFYAATLAHASGHTDLMADSVSTADLTTSEESHLLIATIDESDSLVDTAVPKMLKLLQSQLSMDVVFVSEFVGDEHIFKHVVAKGDAAGSFQEGTARPLEGTWCKKVVEGRLPKIIPDFTKLADAAGLPQEAVASGSYIGTPIILEDGRVYGTICAFSRSAHPDLAEKDLKILEMAAKSAARRIRK